MTWTIRQTAAEPHAAPSPHDTTGKGVSPVPGKWRAAVLYAALTIVLMYPISVRPGQVLAADDPDGHLGIWMLAWNTHAFTTDPLNIFDANTFYPQRRTLAYQDSLIGSALLVAPAIWLTGNPVLAVNLVSLLACVLCGLGAYVLARRLGLSEPAALLCGLIFAFCPARFFRFPQIGLSPVQWIPFTLASLHAYFQGGRRRDLRLALGFFTLQTLTSGHAAVFLVAAVVTVLAYRFALGEPIRLRQRIADAGIPGALLILPAILIYLPYRMNQVQVGLRRGLGSWENPIESFMASPTYAHTYLLSLLGLSQVNEKAHGFLFTGWLPTILMAAAIGAAVAAWRRARPPAAPGALVVLILELVFGAAIAVAGIRTGAYLWYDAAVDPLGLYRLTATWLAAAAAGLVLIGSVRTLRTGATRQHATPVLLLIAAAAVWGALTAARPALPAGDGLLAHYYRDAEWTHPPAMTRVDARPSTPVIMHSWGARTPEVFSVRWIGYITVGRDGSYEFATTSDDGSRLSIDGHDVVDNMGSHVALTKSGVIHLPAGSHRFVLEYVQYGGPHSFSWSWGAEGGPLRTVPDWLLSQRRARYATAVGARIVDWAAWLCLAAAAVGAGWWLWACMPPVWSAWGERVAEARRNPLPLYIVLTALCIGLALGPPYGLWQYVYTWPGFSFIRAPLRFMVLGALGVAVLAAFGFDRLLGKASPARRRAAAAVLGTVLIVEFAGMPVVSVPFTLDLPAADRWLDTRPKPFVIAEVPIRDNERFQSVYMLHSMAHWQKTIAGYGGIRPGINYIMNEELTKFPDETSLNRLVWLGVDYVVVHIDLYRPEEWAEVSERLRGYEWSRLRLEYADPAGRVYSVVPTPGPRRQGH